MAKVAVILFNLGGPDSPRAVRPFLFNLFNDVAIIGAPTPIRWLLAKFIAWRRASVAREIYQKLGGASPLLANTEAQSHALETVLAGSGDMRCFVVMRYWRPRAAEVAAAVKRYAPDRIVLLPLYPQFSTTTTGSSVRDWTSAALAVGIAAPTQTICCYHSNPGFIAAITARISDAIARSQKAPRILFAAHGLPRKVIDGGDPYQWQVERTAAAIVAALGIADLDWLVCYQSRVGPMEWIQPYIGDALEQAGRDGVPVVVAPIGFTSEHSETLVELDIEYREHAAAVGVPHYDRIGTVGVDADFIDGLARLVGEAVADGSPLMNQTGASRCPDGMAGCPFCTA